MTVDPLTMLLADLVAIPSVNPMGRAVDGPTYLEGRLTDYLEQWFQALGVRHERHPVSPGRDNLLAWYDAPDARRTILFDVHQDTVPVEGMTIEPFVPVVEGGRIFGRGACDVKGGMAAMLTAFARLVKERPAGSASVLLACTVDEEFTHTGSSYLATFAHGAELAVVAEPTGLDVVNCHKGAVRWKVRTRGVACHSSTPERGVNAIYKMATVVSALAEHACELAGDRPHPVLGPPSLSVGRIEGGQSVNVVPDLCEIEVDRRVIPGETAADAITRVEAALRGRLGGLEGVDFLPPWVRMPPLSAERPGADRWVEVVRQTVSKSTGRDTRVTGVPFGTDAGPLNETGLPCVVFGPGDIAQAHTKDEWLALDQLALAADAYYEIARVCGH